MQYLGPQTLGCFFARISDKAVLSWMSDILRVGHAIRSNVNTSPGLLLQQPHHSISQCGHKWRLLTQFLSP